MNEYINITLDNIDKEHLCCAISDKKHQEGVKSKKEWLKNKLKDGHVFRKLNTNGKVFIEYEDLSTSWTQVNGNNYLYIYCLWVAGSYKGKGYGKELLEYAIEDAKKNNKKGICTISSKKKKPFLSDKAFFIKYGFKVVDTIGDYELLALNFNDELPKFNDSARTMKIDNKNLTIYYSDECPFTRNSIEEIKEYAIEFNKDITTIKITTLEEAKNVPCIFNNWAVFLNGEFVSNTILNKNMVDKLLK